MLLHQTCAPAGTCGHSLPGDRRLDTQRSPWTMAPPPPMKCQVRTFFSASNQTSAHFFPASYSHTQVGSQRQPAAGWAACGCLTRRKAGRWHRTRHEQRLPGSHRRGGARASTSPGPTASMAAGMGGQSNAHRERKNRGPSFTKLNIELNCMRNESN